MPELATATTSEPTVQAPEPSAAPSPASQASTPNGNAEVQLASLEDALTKTNARPAGEQGKDASDKGRAKGASGSGVSTEQVSKPQAVQTEALAQAEPEPTAGASTEQVSKPVNEQAQASAGQGESGEEGTEPSRRGAAKEIARLTQEVESLRSKAVEVPAEVMAQVDTYRLSDDEFNQLETKLKHQDLTGVQLTPQERDRYNTALTFRAWFNPVYKHALGQAKAWADTTTQQIFDSQAKDLAPVLRDRPYVKAEVISRAQSWSQVYDHIADAALEEGKRLAQADLQPKLDEAKGRIADLEASLSGLRPAAAARSSRPLERGGTETGGSRDLPNLRTARNASELFDAAFTQAQNGRRRRAS